MEYVIVGILMLLMVASWLIPPVFMLVKVIPDIILRKRDNYKITYLEIIVKFIISLIPFIGAVITSVVYGEDIEYIDTYLKKYNKIHECTNCNMLYRANQSNNFKITQISYGYYGLPYKLMKCPHCNDTNRWIDNDLDVKSYIPLSKYKNKLLIILSVYGIVFSKKEIVDKYNKNKEAKLNKKIKQMELIDKQLEAYNKLQELKRDKMLLDIKRIEKELIKKES